MTRLKHPVTGVIVNVRDDKAVPGYFPVGAAPSIKPSQPITEPVPVPAPDPPTALTAAAIEDDGDGDGTGYAGMKGG